MKAARLFGFGILACAMVVLIADAANAQRGGGGNRGGGRGGGGFARGAMGGFGEVMMLRSEQIRDELEVTDEQWDDLQQLQRDMMGEMRNMFQEMRDMDEDERADFMKEVTEDIQAEIGEILLPHQTKRLKQVSLQQSMRRGTGGLLRNQAVIDELDLSDSDIEKLEEKNEEVQKELNEKIAKMRKQAQEEIFSVLSKEQRSKLKEMMGDDFEMQQQNGRGNRGGGRGGRGGGN